MVMITIIMTITTMGTITLIITTILMRLPILTLNCLITISEFGKHRNPTNESYP
jgi:hypothetical protein